MSVVYAIISVPIVAVLTVWWTFGGGHPNLRERWRDRPRKPAPRKARKS